jgi:hypothetical protein
MLTPQLMRQGWTKEEILVLYKRDGYMSLEAKEERRRKS